MTAGSNGRAGPGRSVPAALGAVAMLALAGSAALAEPVLAGDVVRGRGITFDGGSVLGLRCASTPDIESITIPAETSLRIRNRTGYRATLLLDDEAFGEVAKGAVAEVLFHRGPLTVAMQPHCMVTRQDSVRVQVIGATEEQGRPGSAPSAPGPGPSPAASPGAGTDAGQVAGLPLASPGPVGDAGSDPAHPERVDGRLAVAVAPTVAHDSSGGVGGSARPPVRAAGVAERGFDSVAEPMAAVEPVVNRGPVTLLGLLALILITGVLTGAIRAILARRTMRVSNLTPMDPPLNCV